MNKEKKHGFGGKILRLIIVLTILAGGGWAYAYLKNTAPKMQRKPRQPMPTVVEVLKAEHRDTKAMLTAMGSVVAARQIVLRTQVSGEVSEISPNFTPGGRVAKGEMLVRLDPADYEVELKKAKAGLEKAKADYNIEQGYQQVAKEEMKLMEKAGKLQMDSAALALRKPQLNKARADVVTAEASLKKAELNLARTVITAPFNALITERTVDVGSQVSAHGELANLVGTDEYWVEAALPIDRLSKLDLDADSAAPAVVKSFSGGMKWSGRTLRSTGTINQDSRMATVIIAIPNPLEPQTSGASMPLILGDYVSVEIQGVDINQAIELPRTALRDDGSVWVLNQDRLNIRKVNLAWKEKERVFVNDGLMPGDLVITSELNAPVEGMQLVKAENAAAVGNKGGKTPGAAKGQGVTGAGMGKKGMRGQKTGMAETSGQGRVQNGSSLQ